MQARTRWRGFTLLEALIALLLLTVGILGMLGLQNRAQQEAHDAQLRGNAVMLANDLLELMRSNSAALPAYLKPQGADFSGACSAAQRHGGGADVARNDLGCWRERVKQSLPVDAALLARIEICRTQDALRCSAKGSGVLIRLFWADRRSGLCEQGVCSYVLRAEL